MGNENTTRRFFEITVPQDILGSARDSVLKYQMIPQGVNVIPVAASGGKDSVTLIFSLDQLGYRVIPITVDRGDDILFNTHSITDSLQALGFSPHVINLRSRDSKIIDADSQGAIDYYLDQLDHLEPDGIACTPCYNARTIALRSFAEYVGSPILALGMHRTDLLTSFLKFYWMERYFNEFTVTNGIPYTPYRMQEFINGEEIDLNFLSMMVDQKRAATDDPPVGVLSPSVKVIRPLVEVSENTIKAYINSTGFPNDSSNCRYREMQGNTPFRLIVQRDLQQRLQNSPWLENELFTLAMKSINSNGTLKFRPRNFVHQNYPGFDPKIQTKI